jgi:hypothetical protein
MTAQGLAARIFAGVLVVVMVAAGAILAISNKADTAATTGKANREIIATNRARIATNEHKDDATRRCLTVATRPQACVERVTGAQGPGGTGATGARGLMGRRGLSAVGKTGPRGPAGRPGRDAPAPTVEGIADGFAVWCRRVLCVGATGKDGRDGRDAPPVTRAEVMAVVEESCGGSCNGTNGQDAPSPTQEQVNAAVATICAAGGCPAPPGPQGPQGEPGGQVPCAEQDPALGYQCTATVPPP